MAANIRVTCRHDAPAALEWANEINKRYRHPVAEIDGTEHQLRWDEPVDIEVSPGPHHLHVYFEFLGVLRWGAADLDTGSLHDGETFEAEYRVSLRDRYLNTAHLQPLGH